MAKTQATPVRGKAVAGKPASGKPAVKKAAGTKKPTPGKTAAPAPAAPRAPAAAPRTTAKAGLAPGSPWMIVTLAVRSIEAATAFYERAFGFSLDFTLPGTDGTSSHAQLRYQTALLHLTPEQLYGSRCRTPASSGSECPATFYLYCADVDALVQQARAAGARLLSEPAEMYWGDRVASLLDPDGYRWSFATHVDKPA